VKLEFSAVRGEAAEVAWILCASLADLETKDVNGSTPLLSVEFKVGCLGSLREDLRLHRPQGVQTLRRALRKEWATAHRPPVDWRVQQLPWRRCSHPDLQDGPVLHRWPQLLWNNCSAWPQGRDCKPVREVECCARLRAGRCAVAHYFRNAPFPCHPRTFSTIFMPCFPLHRK
jgi:hypothetical protein